MKARLLILTVVLISGFAISSAAQSRTQNLIGPDYLLKSGDSIAVFFWRQSALSRKLVIVDGKVDLPLLGPVQAAGLTPAEFRQIVQGRYSKYISDPNVTIIVTKIAPSVQQRQ
jgi:polysaccharide export outer membrane protein